MPETLAPATAPVYVTAHALARYRERVGPVERDALTQLARDAPLATPEQVARMQLGPGRDAEPGKQYRAAGGVAFVMQREPGWGYRLLTVFRLRA